MLRMVKKDIYSVVTVAASTTTILLLCVVVFSLTVPVCIKRKGIEKRSRSQRVTADADTLQSYSCIYHSHVARRTCKMRHACMHVCWNTHSRDLFTTIVVTFGHLLMPPTFTKAQLQSAALL